MSVGVRRLGEEKDFHTQFGTRKPPAGPKDLYGDPILPPKYDEYTDHVSPS